MELDAGCLVVNLADFQIDGNAAEGDGGIGTGGCAAKTINAKVEPSNIFNFLKVAAWESVVPRTYALITSPFPSPLPNDSLAPARSALAGLSLRPDPFVASQATKVPWREEKLYRVFGCL